MSKLCKVSLVATFTCLLTQCGVFEKVNNLVSDGPPVTSNTQGQEYFTKSAGGSGLNKIAAKIDDSIVTKNEYNLAISPISSQLSAQFPRKNKEYYSALSDAKKNVIEELIDRELILNEFNNIGASIPERQIDIEIERRIATIYNGSRTAYLNDLKKNGLSQSKYREIVKRTVAVNAMKAEHLNDFAPPTTEELNKEYDKFRDKLRDIGRDKAAYKKIWIPLDSDELGATPETQLELAEDIAREIKNGGNFSELAKEFSSDAYAAEGGQWPLTARIDFPVNFAPVIFNSPVGKTIGPLVDEYGYHIIRVTQKVNGPSPPLSKVRPQLEQRVRAEKSAARFKRWVDRLRKNASIKKYL